MAFFMERYKSLMIILLIFLVLCMVIYFQSSKKSASTPLVIAENEDHPIQIMEEEVELEEDEVELWAVDVKGAVKRPGVYIVTSNERVIDVIELAGGWAENAEQNAINLAAKVEDEMVIYVPELGEMDEDIIYPVGQMTGGKEDGKININTATLEEITSLNGIGPKKAQAIIDYREEHGAFQQIDDLQQVSGIGEKTLAGFRDEIVIK